MRRHLPGSGRSPGSPRPSGYARLGRYLARLGRVGCTLAAGGGSLAGLGTAAAFGQPAATADAPAAETAPADGSAEPRAGGGVSASVRPGINDNFLAADLDPAEWLERFEVESREVFAARQEVLAALGLREGMHVADVGAGTGFYAALFASSVGPRGWVYAVDVAPRFVEHIADKSRQDGIANLSAVLCQPDDVGLPPNSIELAFCSDTYHHFEYPHQTLRSIRRALKPAGRLVIIDFEREEGVSREWILDHVRAGKSAVRAEVEAAGFAFESETPIQGFSENYLLVFRRGE